MVHGAGKLVSSQPQSLHGAPGLSSVLLLSLRLRHLGLSDPLASSYQEFGTLGCSHPRALVQVVPQLHSAQNVLLLLLARSC